MVYIVNIVYTLHCIHIYTYIYITIYTIHTYITILYYTQNALYASVYTLLCN